MNNKEQIIRAGKEFPEGLSQETFTQKLADTDVFVIKCPSCGGIHFRHAGYIELVVPFVDAANGAKVSDDSAPVKLCVKCKHSHIMHRGKIIDVTESIDLSAWETTEEEIHAIVGPGGNC